MENIIIFIILIMVGYFSGTLAEANHLRSIRKREKEFVNLPAVTIEDAISQEKEIEFITLVSGSCVVSLDYFKRTLAAIKNIFGGRIGAYETLVDRARREAILRMKEKAKKIGSDIIINTRIETSSIGKNANSKSGLGSV